MVSTSKNIAPFGSKVQRFGKLTLHPNLDSNGLYTKRPVASGPCHYFPKPLNKICQSIRNKQPYKDPWRFQSELEEWAQNLGYRNQKVLREKKWYKTTLGPAWYDVKDIICKTVCKNLNFRKTPRFTSPKNELPGPGTYYKAKPYKALYGPHSVKPSFEWGEPCRFKDKPLNWSLAPNRYRIIDKECIEEKPKKVVSLRGPYELFTGNRDHSTIRNKFSMSSKCTAATWPLLLKGTLNTFENSRFGVMNKTNRSVPYRGRNALIDLSLCLKRPTDPGPAHYYLFKPEMIKQYVHPFNSSYDKPRGYMRTIVWPGVGRYDVKDTNCGVTGHGHRNVFVSKQKRTIGAILPQAMNSF